MRKNNAFPNNAWCSVDLHRTGIFQPVCIVPDTVQPILKRWDDLIYSHYQDEMPGSKWPRADATPARIAGYDLAAYWRLHLHWI